MVTEGLVTEPDYVNHMRRTLRSAPVTIDIDREHGDPLFVVQRAISAREESERARRQHRLEEMYDDIWCLVDVDDHARLGEALRQAEAHGISVAVSNPCFEVWALLHFEDCMAYLARDVAAQRLRGHMPRYEKSLNTSVLAGRFPQARNRALRMEAFHLQGGVAINENPSSGVYRFVESIIARANRDTRAIDDTAF